MPLVVELVRQIESDTVYPSAVRPTMPLEIWSGSETKPVSAGQQTWEEYGRFLRAIGMAQIDNGELRLTSTGREFAESSSPDVLGQALASRLRLFAESLAFISEAPATVDALKAHLSKQYGTDWGSLGQVRARIDWLDAIGAIEATTSHRWQVTQRGKDLLSRCQLVSPMALSVESGDGRELPPEPEAIAEMLDELRTGARDHRSRSNYNIWVPSPADQPNKVENLRIIVNAALSPQPREEFLVFIASTFRLRRSSVDSMLPFLRASGLVSEVSLGVFQATPAAQAWLESGDDVNFIRLLHSRMRFVGEMLRAARSGIERSDLYKEAATFGLNVDKTRWIAAFLQDVQLIAPPKYGSLRTTPYGLALLEQLPLAVPSDTEEPEPPAPPTRVPHESETFPERLAELARSPMALEKGSGKAFEDAVCEGFVAMGFNARTISGSGATDVLVEWQDETGERVVAIVEAKSRASGTVSHTDVSDVALETHKAHHGATYVAIIAPGFAGETIRNMAAKRGWALLEASRFAEIVDGATTLGLTPATTGLLFAVPGGSDALNEAIDRRKRELAVISFTVRQLIEEARQTGDAITPRDISRDGRRTDLQPSVDEVISAFQLIRGTAPTAIRLVEENPDAGFSTYVVGQPKAAAAALRAVAASIEAGQT
jgi:hypothetical protein